MISRFICITRCKLQCQAGKFKSEVAKSGLVGNPWGKLVTEENRYESTVNAVLID